MYFVLGIFTSNKYHTSGWQEKCVKKLPDEWHSMLWSHWSYPWYGQNGVRHERSHPRTRWPSTKATSWTPQHRWLPARLQVCIAVATLWFYNDCPYTTYRVDYFCFQRFLYCFYMYFYDVWRSGDYKISGIFVHMQEGLFPRKTIELKEDCYLKENNRIQLYEEWKI